MVHLGCSSVQPLCKNTKYDPSTTSGESQLYVGASYRFGDIAELCLALRHQSVNRGRCELAIRRKHAKIIETMAKRDRGDLIVKCCMDVASLW